MALEFDERLHRYTLDGRILPSVSQIINAILPMRPVDDYYLTRGTATHRACELYDRGTLDPASVDPEIAPRLEAWKKFRADFGGEIVANEMRLASRSGFAGTLDRVIGSRSKPVIIDIKSSCYPQAILQLGGYSILWRENAAWTAAKAGVVEVREDGSYACFWLDKQALRRAEQRFLALLSVFNFAREHHLKEQ